MVTRNEADRYLEVCLSALRGATAATFVYDDQSTDDTRAICEKWGCAVFRRPNHVPNFESSEGRFRMAAWMTFEEKCRPQEGDWVLSIDADEIIVADDRLEDKLRNLAADAADAGVSAVNIPIPEAWGFSVGPPPLPLIRTDGYWGDLKAPRLFAYKPGGRYRLVDMACGSAPTYVQPPYLLASGLEILHLGYADRADRQIKYRRYASRPGHNPAHVASILSTSPTLREWAGPFPQAGWGDVV